MKLSYTTLFSVGIVAASAYGVTAEALAPRASGSPVSCKCTCPEVNNHGHSLLMSILHPEGLGCHYEFLEVPCIYAEVSGALLSLTVEIGCPSVAPSTCTPTKKPSKLDAVIKARSYKPTLRHLSRQR